MKNEVPEAEEDFKNDIAALMAAVEEAAAKRLLPPARPRFACYIISLAWNEYAKEQFGVAANNMQGGVLPSLEAIRAKFDTCVDARTFESRHTYGSLGQYTATLLLLSFKDEEPARAARLQLQDERVRQGLPWARIQYARNIENLFTREACKDDYLSFELPLANFTNELGAKWISDRLQVPWTVAMEEPIFVLHQPRTGGVPKIVCHSHSFGRNWKSEILARIHRKPARKLDPTFADDCYKCGQYGHSAKVCKAHALQLFLNEPMTWVAKSELSVQLKAHRIVCGSQDFQPEKPPNFGVAFFSSNVDFKGALTKVTGSVGRSATKGAGLS